MDTTHYAGLVYHLPRPGQERIADLSRSHFHHQMSWQPPYSHSRNSSFDSYYPTTMSRGLSSDQWPPSHYRHSSDSNSLHSFPTDSHRYPQDRLPPSAHTSARHLQDDSPDPSGGPSYATSNDREPSYMLRPPLAADEYTRSSQCLASSELSAAMRAEGLRDDHPSREPIALHSATPPNNYSPYTFYPTHSRSASDSCSASSVSNDSTPSSYQRSASPATSVTSVHTVSSSMSTPKSRPPETGAVRTVAGVRKHKKQRLFNMDRKRICEYAEANKHMKQEDIAKVFQVERSTISKILKNKDKWSKVTEEQTLLLCRFTRTLRPTKFPALDEALEPWLRECNARKVIFTDAMIRNKALEVMKELPYISDAEKAKFKASSGWVENFKHRYNIRKGIWVDNNQPYTYQRYGGGIGFDLVDDARKEIAPGGQNYSVNPKDDTDTLPSGSSYRPVINEEQQRNTAQTSAEGALQSPLWDAPAPVADCTNLRTTMGMPNEPPITSSSLGLPPLHEARHMNPSFDRTPLFTCTVPRHDTYTAPPPAPSADEAGVALDKIMAYVNAQGDRLSPAQREALEQMKENLFKDSQQNVSQSLDYR